LGEGVAVPASAQAYRLAGQGTLDRAVQIGRPHGLEEQIHDPEPPAAGLILFL
jgi:hypothetical protein